MCFNNYSTAFISGSKQVTQVLFRVRKKIRVACFILLFVGIYFICFLSFETFDESGSNCGSNQVQEKGYFGEQNSSLTATGFNLKPSLFSSKCHIKFWYNRSKFCFIPVIYKADSLLSFPLTFLWGELGVPKIKSPMRIIVFTVFNFCGFLGFQKLQTNHTEHRYNCFLGSINHHSRRWINNVKR